MKGNNAAQNFLQSCGLMNREVSAWVIITCLSGESQWKAVNEVQPIQSLKTDVIGHVCYHRYYYCHHKFSALIMRNNTLCELFLLNLSEMMVSLTGAHLARLHCCLFAVYNINVSATFLYLLVHMQ